MSNKTFTIRISKDAPDVSSDQVAGWLEAQLESDRELAADPGAGERSLRLSLDKQAVEQGARVAGEPEAAFLRRVIATNISLQQEKPEATEDKARPKATVLKGAMRLRPDQVRPLVRVLEAGQAYAIRKTLHLPLAAETTQATAYTEEERDRLSTVGAEVINRRAPAWLVENGDVFALLTEIAAIETRKIEAALGLAQQIRQAQAQQSAAEQQSVPLPPVQ
jgi:hypothetical protein